MLTSHQGRFVVFPSQQILRILFKIFLSKLFLYLPWGHLQGTIWTNNERVIQRMYLSPGPNEFIMDMLKFLGILNNCKIRQVFVICKKYLLVHNISPRLH